MSSSRESPNAGKPSSGSSSKLVPGSLRSIANQAPKYTHRRQSSSSSRPLRTIAPRPRPPPSADPADGAADVRPGIGERPPSPSATPLSFIAWTPCSPSPQPQSSACRAGEVEPAIDRPSLIRPAGRLPVRPRSSSRALPAIDTSPSPSTSQQSQSLQAVGQTAADQVVLAPIWRPRSFSSTPAPTIAPSRLSLSPQQQRQQLLQSTAQAVIDQVALGRPRSQSNHVPPLIAPSLLCSSPQQQQQQQQQPSPQAPSQIPISEVTVVSARPRPPPVSARVRPRHVRSQSWSTRPLRTLRPKPEAPSTPQPQPAEPSSHYDLLASRLLSPSRTAVSAPRPVTAPTSAIVTPVSAPSSNTASPITQAAPHLTVLHPFWASGTAEILPCDESGTIRDAYKRVRLQEVENLHSRVRPPYWTVRHIQEVCTDIHRMPAAARAGFGDLHKQIRELYDLHTHIMGLYPPSWAHPDDIVAVEGAGFETMLPRVLRDFILGMNEHLLGAWRPFSRERVEWNVHSKHSFLEDFSCFLEFHNKFYGQRVILMQAPAAPGWSEQSNLRFYDGIRFRGYLERQETGLTKYETERKSFVDCFWDT